jgi:hypothetical protein
MAVRDGMIITLLPYVVRQASAGCRIGGEDTKQTKINEIYEKVVIFRMFRYFSYVSYFSLLAWRRVLRD